MVAAIVGFLLCPAVMRAQVAGAPTNVTGSGLNGQALVSFTAPASHGGSAITSYTVTATPSISGAPYSTVTASGSKSPILVTGLYDFSPPTYNALYTFTVTANNTSGAGPASAASPAVVMSSDIPTAPPIGTAVTAGGAVVVNFSQPVNANSGGVATITGYIATASPGGSQAASSQTPIIFAPGQLTPGVSYTFVVNSQISSGGGIGDFSTASNAVTSSNCCPTVRGHSATPTLSSAWMRSTTADVLIH